MMVCRTCLLIDSDEKHTEDDDDEAYALSSASGAESDTSNSEDEGSMDSWTSDIGEHNRFTFDEDYGVHGDVFSCGEPIDFFKLFLYDDIMDLITAETNKYGNAKLPQLEKRSLKQTTEKCINFSKCASKWAW
nr:similar to piggyBac-derived 2 (AGAP012114-PA) [Haemonchus contortus]